jgi:enoyl-CoA hydratase
LRVTADVLSGVARVAIDNPPVNALSASIISQLDDVMDDLLVDAAVRVVVIRGSGDRAFVAGADIREFPLDASPSEVRRSLALRTVLQKLDMFAKPVIAQIHGHCLGGGLELAMACDIRVAAESASLGQPEVRLGLIPGAGGTQRLPRLVGRGRALELNLTGTPISGSTAAAWGLVDHAVPLERLDEEVDRLATAIASQSPAAVAQLVQLEHETRELSLADGLASEKDAFVAMLSSDDAREGIEAFLEKRPPVWGAVRV